VTWRKILRKFNTIVLIILNIKFNLLHNDSNIIYDF
jgi:hypothetical protein